MKDSRDQVKKIYKPTIYRIILNVIYSFFGVILLFYLLTYFINNINVVILISLIFLICYYKIVIYDTYIIICIDDDKLIYKKRNKTKYYDINKCQFSAKIVNTTGDSGCVLYITDESGNFNSIDCELIGYSQFNNLLNDLKIIGDEARPIKIKTIMKLANINQLFFTKKLNLFKICKKGQNSPLPPKLLLNNYVFSRFLYTSITRA